MAATADEPSNIAPGLADWPAGNGPRRAGVSTALETKTISAALQQWVTQMPAGSAIVDAAADRVTLTACDPGSAATAIPNPPIASLVYLSSRDGLFSELLKSGFSSQEATCSADTVVRDPVFAPVIEAAGTDPNAEPDPALVTAVQQRVREIVAGCKQT